jgi:hypothetical protein
LVAAQPAACDHEAASIDLIISTIALVADMRLVCTQCGAAGLLDIGKLKPDAAQSALRTAVMAYLKPSEPGLH